MSDTNQGGGVEVKRNSSFELLRLVLMTLIVVHHSIIHGLGSPD